MSEAEAALIGALAGALTALLAAGVAGFFTLRVERIRQERERREAHVQRLRLEARELFRAMFAIQHAIQNLCWYARYHPTKPESTARNS